MGNFALDPNYIDVSSRIVEFRKKHPECSLQPVDPAHPFAVQTIGDKTFIVVTAAAYRNPDDKRPGIGMAWEPFPGRTPYTRDSELQNAETSAWGRAIVAAMAADTNRGIASAEEVRNRSAEREQDTPQQRRAAQDRAAEAPQAAPRQRRAAENGQQNGNGQVAMANPDQLTKLHTIFTNGGVTKRETCLEACCLMVGRELTTSKELTRVEAARVINQLEDLAKEPVGLAEMVAEMVGRAAAQNGAAS